MWLTALGLLGLGAAGASSGILLSRRAHSVAGERAVTATPSAAVRAPLVPTEVQPPGVALPTFITPTTDFYRIDTALVVPQLSRADWRLRVHGMVNREIIYMFDDLRAFPLVEKAVTLTCVSNPVGGDLISTAMWTGYRVRDLLAAAGIHPDADMVLSTSIDGFTAGTPVEALTDGRDSLLAVGMNGEPLPINQWLPRTARGSGAVRLRLGHQVGRRTGIDPLRQGSGVLDWTRLVGTWPDQNPVTH